MRTSYNQQDCKDPHTHTHRQHKAKEQIRKVTKKFSAMSTHSHSNRQLDKRDGQGLWTTSWTHSLVLSLSMAIAQKTTETLKRIVVSLGPLSTGIVVEQSIRQESVKRRRCGTMPTVRLSGSAKERANRFTSHVCRHSTPKP